MSDRLRDEEFARFAARHTLHPQGQDPRPHRLEPLKEQGVTDEKSLADHTLKVMQASDTKCFRGAYGREVYANDRMNTIVITNENKPDKSSVYFNDKIVEGISATDRLESMSNEERKDYKIDCKIREGGSQALEQDRIARLLADRPLNQDTSRPFPSQQPSFQPEQQKGSNPTQQAPELSRVNLPRYAAVEHGYKASPRGDGKVVLTKDGEELRATRGAEGAWTYQNRKQPDDKGDITAFAAKRGAGDERGAETAVNEYLKRNPGERPKDGKDGKAGGDDGSGIGTGRTTSGTKSPGRDGGRD